jgi:prevent-host-death family protein
VKDISATEAARNFSDVLDAVEHRHEAFLVTRSGRTVAKILPVDSATGRALRDVVRRHRPDPAWLPELEELRALLVAEEPPWNG